MSQPTATMSATTIAVGNNSRHAARKLSIRKPMSLNVSARSRCDKYIASQGQQSWNSNCQSAAPGKESITHSAIRHEVATDAISQAQDP